MVQGDNCKPERESIKDKKKEESYIGDRLEKKGEKLFTQQNYQSAHEAEIVTNIARLRDFRDLEGIKSNAQSRFVGTSRVGHTHESSGRGTTLRPVDDVRIVHHRKPAELSAASILNYLYKCIFQRRPFSR